MNKLNKILEFEIININDYSLLVSDLIIILLIFAITVLILRLIKKIIDRNIEINKLDKGSSYALFQLIKYIIWIISISLMLKTVGLDLNLLLTGSAAFLVAIGLGLQETFNDILSGVILLIEKTIKIDDILEIDGDIVVMTEIGLRTSKVLNRHNVTITLPNSVVTTSKVINWSYQSKKTLFEINVGVAYGSDLDLVINLLNDSAYEHKELSDRELVESRFINFGNSSLDFSLLFFSDNLWGIEKVKSDIRKTINRKFIENNITIPFPQIDLHLKSGINVTNIENK